MNPQRRKLSLEDLRVESFVTSPLSGVEGMIGMTQLCCGLTCTSMTCDGVGPTCSKNCEGVTYSSTCKT